jgi:hypothetical protein
MTDVRSAETLLESLNGKIRQDDVYAMTLEELIAWWGSRSYSPVGQATLNHLEKLQRLTKDSTS